MRSSLRVLVGVLLIVSLAVFLTACGSGGDNSSGGGGGESITGNWNGNWTNSNGVDNGTLKVEFFPDSSALVSLSGSICSSFAIVFVNVSGNNISFQYGDKIDFTATYTSNSMEGTYVVTTNDSSGFVQGSCLGSTGDTGNFSMNK